MFMDVFMSVLKASLTGAMVFISIVRIGLIAYPDIPEVNNTSAPTTFEKPEIAPQEIAPVVRSQVASPQATRRIILGRNSIQNLGQSN